LDTGTQIGSLSLQDDEFIVLIPFAKKQCLNNLSINDMTAKVVSSGEDHKHMLNSGNEQSIPHTSGSLLEEKSWTSGSHTQAVADAAWLDIVSLISGRTLTRVGEIPLIFILLFVFLFALSLVDCGSLDGPARVRKIEPLTDSYP